jgi:hypothetical protein
MDNDLIERIRYLCVKSNVPETVMGAICHEAREHAAALREQTLREAAGICRGCYHGTYASTRHYEECAQTIEATIPAAPKVFTAQELADMDSKAPAQCSLSFTHPAHDYCDGNPDGGEFANCIKAAAPAVDAPAGEDGGRQSE